MINSDTFAKACAYVLPKTAHSITPPDLEWIDATFSVWDDECLTALFGGLPPGHHCSIETTLVSESVLYIDFISANRDPSPHLKEKIAKLDSFYQNLNLDLKHGEELGTLLPKLNASDFMRADDGNASTRCWALNDWIFSIFRLHKGRLCSLQMIDIENLSHLSEAVKTCVESNRKQETFDSLIELL